LLALPDRVGKAHTRNSRRTRFWVETRGIVTRVSLVAVICSAVVALAKAPPPPAAKQKEREALSQALVQAIASSPLASSRLSVQVKSLDDGAVVFSRDGEELLNPASNVKLFTAAAALSKLGPEFRFDTEFLTDQDFKQGKTRLLYVRGKGDPTITTERLYAMVGEVVHAGLKEVGDIVVDESYFDAERDPPGFDQESGDRPYLAPTGALSLNWNTVGVYLRPGDSVGAEGVTELEPPSDYFTVDAQLTTGTKMQRRFTVSSTVDRDRVKQKFEVRGVVPVEKGTWAVWKKIDQPGLYFGYTVKQLLKDRGVKVKGRVRAGVVPTTGAKLLSVAQSDTLDIVLKRMNKHSSNFVAEQLIKTLGAEGRGVPGTTAHGIDVVEDFLAQEVGLPRGSYVMKNGSGLNDTNRFSAAQINRLLVVMWERFPTAPEYLSALGIAGKDGTLKYRFEGTDAVGRLRAKTGTLENVSALSGYVQAVGGERFVFSVLVNDFHGRASTVVPSLDTLGAAVAAEGSALGPRGAIAAMTTPSVVGPYEELKSRLKTYAALTQKAEKKNAPFLRTAWRSEKDPAVRAAIADALYQSDPREPANVRIFLDSALAVDDVYGRLRRAALDAKLDVPLISSLVELASGGNGDAIARLLEFVRASAADDAASATLSEHLAVVANDAPAELLWVLRTAPEQDRAAAVDSMVKGLAAMNHVGQPFWDALREAHGSVDPAMAAFAKDLDEVLSQKIAASRAPAVDPTAAATDPAVRPANAAATAPGG